MSPYDSSQKEKRLRWKAPDLADCSSKYLLTVNNVRAKFILQRSNIPGLWFLKLNRLMPCELETVWQTWLIKALNKWGTHRLNLLLVLENSHLLFQKDNQLKDTFFFSLFFPINFNGYRTSVTQNVMGQEDGWVHLKPLVTGQEHVEEVTVAVQSSTIGLGIFSECDCVAVWLQISTQSPYTIHHTSTGHTFKVTFPQTCSSDTL